MKPYTAVVAPGEDVVLPKFPTHVTFEAELCVVIGQPCNEVEPDDAKDFIFGFTCGNDLTAKDVQNADGRWTRAKGFDTSPPLGPPWIEPNLDITALPVQGQFHGQLRKTPLQCSWFTTSTNWTPPYRADLRCSRET